MPAAVQLGARVGPFEVLRARVRLAEGDVVAQGKAPLVDARAAGQLVASIPAVVEPRVIPPRPPQPRAVRLEEVVPGVQALVVLSVDLLARSRTDPELVGVLAGGLLIFRIW